MSYAIVDGTLYPQSYNHLQLHYLSKHKSQQIVIEVHLRLCGVHKSGSKMKSKIKQIEYYWPSMITDYMYTMQCCHQCQVDSVVRHLPPNILHPTKYLWPFEYQGENIVSPIDPLSSKGHYFILVVINYISKWAKGIP